MAAGDRIAPVPVGGVGLLTGLGSAGRSALWLGSGYSPDRNLSGGSDPGDDGGGAPSSGPGDPSVGSRGLDRPVDLMIMLAGITKTDAVRQAAFADFLVLTTLYVMLSAAAAAAGAAGQVMQAAIYAGAAAAVGSAASAAWSIAFDPPQHDYRRVVDVEFVDVPIVEDSDVMFGAMKRFISHTTQWTSYTKALNDTIERWQGARLAGDDAWAFNHTLVAEGLKRLMNRARLQQAESLHEFAMTIRGTIHDRRIGPDSITSARRTVRTMNVSEKVKRTFDEFAVAHQNGFQSISDEVGLMSERLRHSSGAMTIYI
jgi:hypothetical protein